MNAEAHRARALELLDEARLSTGREVEVRVAEAQVHATLALASQPLEAVLGEAIDFAVPRVGSRVVLLRVDETARPRVLLANDAVGTVTRVWHSEIGGELDRAEVDWDDAVSVRGALGDQFRSDSTDDYIYTLAELRVVLGV